MTALNINSASSAGEPIVYALSAVLYCPELIDEEICASRVSNVKGCSILYVQSEYEMKLFAIASAFAMLVSLVTVPLATAAGTGVTRQIPVAGAGTPQSGGFTPSGLNDAAQAEFPGQLDEPDGPGPYPGTIVNRSLSKGSRQGASTSSGKKAKSNPLVVRSFEGLNFYQQRYARGGNQFSLEPPDQGLCAGNGFVLETVNQVHQRLRRVCAPR